MVYLQVADEDEHDEHARDRPGEEEEIAGEASPEEPPGHRQRTEPGRHGLSLQHGKRGEKDDGSVRDSGGDTNSD